MANPNAFAANWTVACACSAPPTGPRLPFRIRLLAYHWCGGGRIIIATAPGCVNIPQASRCPCCSCTLTFNAGTSRVAFRGKSTAIGCVPAHAHAIWLNQASPLKTSSVRFCPQEAGTRPGSASNVESHLDSTAPIAGHSRNPLHSSQVRPHPDNAMIFPACSAAAVSAHSW